MTILNGVFVVISTDCIDRFVPVFLPFENFDFDPQEVDGGIKLGGFQEANRILFGRDDHIYITVKASFHEAVDLLLGEVMVVREGAMELDFCALLFKERFEAFGDGNTTDRGDIFTFHEGERMTLTGEEVLKFYGFMSAFD